LGSIHIRQEVFFTILPQQTQNYPITYTAGTGEVAGFCHNVMRPSLNWNIKQQKLIVVILGQHIGPISSIKKSKELALEDMTD
jgi:hypothetical protein